MLRILNILKKLFFNAALKAVAFLVVFLSLTGCDQEEVARIEIYEGPLLEVDSVTTLWSDSAVVRIKLIAKKQYEYEGGDRSFPDGVYIEFFDKDGNRTSSLRADRGYFTKTDNLYKADGDVEVINFENNEKLNTEELFWKPDDKKIYTDKFVKIETDGQLVTGDGLTANQDFSNYKIINPKDGYFTLDQE
jgi:LPS export ABC transporter protein LptC